MIERIEITDRTPYSIWLKLNPLWWLRGPDGWTVPTINNGKPYLPEVTNKALRIFYWFFCRNFAMNFVGYVMGVEDKNGAVIGSFPVMKTTLRDADTPMTGWKWSYLDTPISPAALAIFAISVAGLWSLPLFWAWPLIAIAYFAALKGVGYLPFIAYWNGKIEFYLGWRASTGGFGFKSVFPGA